MSFTKLIQKNIKAMTKDKKPKIIDIDYTEEDQKI